MFRKSPVIGAAIFALYLLSGCHTIERSKKCQLLAEAFEQNEADLAPVLPPDPAPEVLTHKAELYQKLGKQLKGLKLMEAELKTPRDELIESLDQLAKHLHDAAQAASELKTETEAADRANKEFSDAQGARKRDSIEAAQKPPTKPIAGPPKKTDAQSRGRSIPAEERLQNNAPVHRTRARKAERNYLKAKTAIEGLNREIAATMRRLQDLCR
jgi:outer membrane murein-binding lipoprotein Lpp